ncbi:hypothetical protein QEN19_002069 [Hanseniaspora menglaensis]
MLTNADEDIVITKEVIYTDTFISHDSLIEQDANIADSSSEHELKDLFPTAEQSDIDANKQQNYRIWKKNSKILYDYINTNNLKWPSLSVNVLPYVNKAHNDRLFLITSFTSDQLPEDEKVILTSMRTLNIPKSDLNSFEMENMEFQVIKNIDSKSKKEHGLSSNKIDTTLAAKDEVIKEYKPQNLKNEIEITYSPSEQCNRVAVNMNNPDIFATASTKFGNIYIYDKTKCVTTNSSVKNLMSSNHVINLNGFNASEDVEVTSLEWNNMKQTELASGLSNGLLQVWDLRSSYKTDVTTYHEPTAFTVVDDTGVNDISYMPDHDSIIAVGCENLYMQLFDTRAQNTILKTLNKNEKNSVNSLQFNPKNSNLIAVGSGDETGEINIHDIRRIQTPVLTFNHSSENTNNFISNNNSISKVQWNPFLPNVLLSAGMEDGLIKIWDTTAQQNASYTQKTFASKLIFTHGGHMLGITDCCWDLFDPWTVVSCSFDNALQIWKPAKRIIDEYFI